MTSARPTFFDPDVAGGAAVISGHTHRASIEYRNNVLYLDPGIAGPREPGVPATVALLHIDGSNVAAELVTIDE